MNQTGGHGVQITITSELAQQLLDYLAAKPYREVYTLIAALMQAAAPPKPEDETGE